MNLNTHVSLLALAGGLLLAAPATAQIVNDTNSMQPQTDTAADSSNVKAAAISGQAPESSGDGEIVVTGTRIVRPNSTAAAPITSVTAADIRAQAPINVEEVLNRLPQISPDSQQNYQDSDGRQRIKLRSLGFERTLVLVDGKRLGTQNGQDTNIIPVALIERVDVLTGGASSVYGSDAVAGVVNFVMKQNFTGVRIDANYNFYNHVNQSNVVTQTAQNSASRRGSARSTTVAVPIWRSPPAPSCSTGSSTCRASSITAMPIWCPMTRARPRHASSSRLARTAR